MSAPLPLGVILAGGQARRMGGGDKGRLELLGRPLFAHVIARLSPQVSGLVLNGNGDPQRFADLGLPVVADPVAGFAGPLAGVLAGLDHAAGAGAEWIVTAAADTPFLPHDLVARLRTASEAKGGAIALAATTPVGRGQTRHPTFGLWPVALRGDLRAALDAGTRKVVAWTDRHGAVDALFPSDGIDPFFNINAPEDLQRAGEVTA